MCMAVPCVVLAGCAGVGTRNTAGADAGSPYAQLDASTRAYEVAWAKARNGQSQATDQAMRDALAKLRAAAARCADTVGCDEQRFMSAYSHLLQLDDGDVALDLADHDDDGDLSVDQAVPQAQRTITLLHGHKLSDLIAMNGPVKAALEQWLTWRRPALMRSYVNYQYLRHLMWPQFKKAGLPEAVLFGILTKESNGRVNAVSSADAKGPLQFMYATGARFGLHYVDGFDQRFDPALSSKAAAAFLNEQLKVFNDNLELVLAAYNAGSGRIRRQVNGDTGMSFYDPDVYFDLPKQTRRYVPLVLAASWLFLHPERYHLTWPKIDATPGQIKLARQASLSEVAICLGQDEGMRTGWWRTLRNLNPRLSPQDELPPGTVVHVPRKLESAYARDCTDGPWPILAADLHSGTVPAPPPSGLPRHYIVRSGDTLSGIVRKLGCSSVHSVARLNGLGRHYGIRVGQQLTLPRCY